MKPNIKIKNILLTIALSVCGMAAVSCSDFLDLSNPSAVTSDNWWNNKEEAESSLAGCYNVLLKQGLYYNYYNSADPRALDAFGTTDGDSGWWFWSPAENDLYWGKLSATSDLVKTVWDVCYMGIARCNEVIYNVPMMGEEKIESADADRIIGEAKFLRAYYYFYLTQYFRDVPLSLEPTATGHIAVSPKSKVIETITKDLEDVVASGCLPEGVGAAERGRASKGAALGLLTRIYLYNGYWEKAAERAADVMTLGYSLEPDYLTLFSEAGCNSPEIIFAARFKASADSGDNDIAGYLSTRNQEEHVSFMTVTSDLLKEYYDIDGNPVEKSGYSENELNDGSKRDPRYCYNFEGFESKMVSEDWINWEEVTTAHINKYQDWSENKWKDDQDYYIIRYADILLMRAEALCMLNSSKDEIVSLINQVRDRASVKMPHVTDEEIAYHSSLLNLIKHERRVEFAFEGLRYADLKRWGEYDKLRETKAVGETRAVVWPIPQQELDNNPVLVQAPEWGGTAVED